MELITDIEDRIRNELKACLSVQLNCVLQSCDLSLVFAWHTPTMRRQAETQDLANPHCETMKEAVNIIVNYCTWALTICTAELYLTPLFTLGPLAIHICRDRDGDGEEEEDRNIEDVVRLLRLQLDGRSSLPLQSQSSTHSLLAKNAIANKVNKCETRVEGKSTKKLRTQRNGIEPQRLHSEFIAKCSGGAQCDLRRHATKNWILDYGVGTRTFCASHWDCAFV